MFYRLICLSALILSTLGSSPRALADIDTESVFQGFNALVFNDFVAPSSDVQGRLAAARDVRLSHYSVGAVLTFDSTRADIVAGRDLVLTGGSVPRGGAIYGNTISLNEASVFGLSVRGPGIDFVEARNRAVRVSSQLAMLAANAQTTVTYTGARAQVDLLAAGPLVNVFDLSGSDLSHTHTFDLNAPAGATIIINVHGDSVSLSNFAMFYTGGIQADRVLFNFPEARSLVIRDIAVEGSILAPFAQISFPQGLLDGNLVAAGFEGAGQFNLAVNVVPATTPTPTPTPAPTPTATPTPRLHCSLDDFSDSVSINAIGGTTFEIYAMGVKQIGSSVTFIINANLPIEGASLLAPKHTNYVHIGWGDLFLNFSGALPGRFSTVTPDNLYAVHFAEGTDSGVSSTGLFRTVTPKAVEAAHLGRASYGSYYNHVTNNGHQVGMGDLEPRGGYLDFDSRIPNSIATGTQVEDDEFRINSPDETALLAKELAECVNVSASDMGSQVIAFTFKRPPEMVGDFVAHISPECGNDVMAVKWNLE